MSRILAAIGRTKGESTLEFASTAMNTHSNTFRCGGSLISSFMAVCLLMAVSMPSYGSILTMGLDVEFSGATAPEGSTPWITAVFEDVGAKMVELTMSATNLVDAEAIDDWLFNIDPSLDLGLLSIAAIDNSASVPNSIGKQHNTFKADGDGDYDILFDFPPPPGSTSARFTSGESVIYKFTYSGSEDFDVFSFDFFDDGGSKGDFRSAAHIQRIGSSDSDSGWIGDGTANPPGGGAPIPEPTSVAVWALLTGIAAVITAKRRG